MHSDSPAWALYSCVSFVVAVVMMGIGITMIPGDSWIHAYHVGAVADRLVLRAGQDAARPPRGAAPAPAHEEAKTEQLLKTYELKPPLTA